MEETGSTATAPPATGRFVWHELLSTDAETSGGFYAALMGWKAEPQGDGHALLRHPGNGRPVASLARLGDGTGIESCWVGCVEVDDVDGFARAMQGREGAVALPPTLGRGGRQTLVADRRGALLAACSADRRLGTLTAFVPEDTRQRRGGRIRMPSPGHFCWDQLNTHDLEAAQADYAALLPWRAEPRPVPNAETATTPGAAFWCGDCVAAGAMQVAEGDDGERPMPDHWLPFVRVDELASRVERAVELGGRVLLKPICSDGIGCVAVLQDPTGAVIGLWEGPSDVAKG